MSDQYAESVRCDHRDDWGEWLGQWQRDRCGMEAYRCAHCGAILEPREVR